MSNKAPSEKPASNHNTQDYVEPHAAPAKHTISETRRYITLFVLLTSGFILQYCRHNYLHTRIYVTKYPGPISDNLDRLKPDRIPRKASYLIEATTGAVASDNKICSEVGVDILKSGGNAVDSAISTTLCIGVVNMFSSGIGGGGFMMVRLPPSFLNGSGPSEVFTLDFREKAPAASYPTMYASDPDASRRGGMSIAVPGELRGLEEAHKRWGTLPWHELVQPSIDIASGWTVDAELARRIRLPPHRQHIMENDDWAAIFAPEGELLKRGEIIQRNNLSRTLDIIARNGASAFYEGPIADTLVSKIHTEGGILTHDDLLDYNVIFDTALEGSYGGRKLYTTKPPTAGNVLLHMLNLLEPYNFMQEGMTALNIHRFVEAMKFGFAARTKVFDPAFGDPKIMADIHTKEYAAAIQPRLTDNETHTAEYYNPVYDAPGDHGTSHTSIVDKDGMAVSITTSISRIFGSGIMEPETGVILNDEMCDFFVPGMPNVGALWPSPYNYPEPGKRPLSSIAPVIVEDSEGALELVIGGAGGSRIFPAVIQVMLNLDWGMDLRTAIEHGRVHHELYPEEIDADNVYPVHLLKGLKERGHNITVWTINRIAAVINAVQIHHNGTIHAASDSRKRGIAAGY